MKAEPVDPKRLLRTVRWLWLFILLSVCLQYYAFTRGIRGPFKEDKIPWLLALLPIVPSALIRWLLLPRLMNARIDTFTVGAGLAGCTAVTEFFLCPEHAFELLIFSLAGMAQYTPITWRGLFYIPLENPPPEHP